MEYPLCVDIQVESDRLITLLLFKEVIIYDNGNISCPALDFAFQENCIRQCNFLGKQSLIPDKSSGETKLNSRQASYFHKKVIMSIKLCCKLSLSLAWNLSPSFSLFCLGPSMNRLVTDGNTKLCCRGFILALFQSSTDNTIDTDYNRLLPVCEAEIL